MTAGTTQPRYLQLARELHVAIQSGRYPVGDLMPTEIELCRQFGASRFTIREAVKQLVDMGLVSRQAGVGTRVLTSPAPRAYRQVMGGIADLQQYTADTELEILDAGMVEVRAELCAMLGARPGESWLRIEGLRRVEDEHAPPICFTEIYLRPDFRSVRHLGGRSGVPVYVRLEEQFGVHIAEVQQQIRALAMTVEMAARLESEPGGPALSVCRTYLDRRGAIIEVALSTHPADRFSYQESFRRDWQAAGPPALRPHEAEPHDR